jgi:predicted ATPase
MKFIDKKGYSIPHENLPRLIVLTGLNGSGKTRGLKQLQTDDPDGTQYIDYLSFSAKWNQSAYADNNQLGESILRDAVATWKFAAQVTQFGQPININTYYQGADEEKKRIILSEHKEKSKFANLFSVFMEIFPEAHHKGFDQHAEMLRKDEQKANEYWRIFSEDSVASVYKKISRETYQPAHCITDEEAIKGLDQLQRLKHPLSMNLVALLNEYAEKRKEFVINTLLTNPCTLNAIELFSETNPNPVEQINEIFERFADKERDIFQFSVETNIAQKPTSYKELQELQPINEVKLVNVRKGGLRELSELSSGEKTLLALSTLMYTHKYIQPMRALYLDEIDASLHPSMIESMLEIL